MEISNLSTVFETGQGKVNAISEISFTLYRGETVGIVGESGSGKSVTSLAIMKLIPEPPGKIVAGEIRFHPKENVAFDLLQASEENVRVLRGHRIAMIFQEPMTSLNPVMRCGDQVMEALLLHKKMSRGEAEQRVLELFAEVQLPDPPSVFARYPHQLSGGQKQRVMIAMAMSCDPDVLIADEPTTALDVTVQKTILQLMSSLQKKYGMGIIFITHDLGVIAEIADRVVVMYRGRIVEQATVLDLFSNAKHPYTKSLLACRPPLDRRPLHLPVVSDFLTVDPDGTFVENAEAVKKVQIVSTESRSGSQARLRQAPALIEVRNLSTWFPSEKDFFGRVSSYLKAVDNVSLVVWEGETLGLVGESGCGKSTLGRTLLRLAPAREGAVLYRGTDLLKLSEEQFRPFRKKMQIIFQDPYSSLNPRMTVGEAVREPMQVHGLYRTDEERMRKAYELLHRVGLDERHYDRYPHEFSGGQRQRVCIARALAVEPEFIICDESVSALDVSVQAQVLNLLNDLKRELRFTCIFISHDLGVVKFMSDRMMVMQKGRIVEEGDPDLIYENPSNDYTRQLIGSIPDGSLQNINRLIAARRS